MKQAGYAWYREIETVLKKMKFKEIAHTNGVFTKSINKDEKLILELYVDDLYIMSTCEKTIKQFKEDLNNEYDLKYFGSISEFLAVTSTYKDALYNLDQKEYFMNLIDKFNINKNEKKVIPISC